MHKTGQYSQGRFFLFIFVPITIWYLAGQFNMLSSLKTSSAVAVTDSQHHAWGVTDTVVFGATPWAVCGVIALFWTHRVQFPATQHLLRLAPTSQTVFVSLLVECWFAGVFGALAGLALSLWYLPSISLPMGFELVDAKTRHYGMAFFTALGAVLAAIGPTIRFGLSLRLGEGKR